jgi:hypothetical protein
VEVHPLIDAYVVMRNLYGDNFIFLDSCEFGNRWDMRSPYKGNLYINFIALYKDKVVFLIGDQTKKYLSELFNSQGIEYEIIDYDTTVQFRVKMTPEQIIEFHSNFNNTLRRIEDDLSGS